jgi:hypothetical protein
MAVGEMDLQEALNEIRSFEQACRGFDQRMGLVSA